MKLYFFDYKLIFIYQKVSFVSVNDFMIFCFG